MQSFWDAYFFWCYIRTHQTVSKCIVDAFFAHLCGYEDFYKRGW